MATYCSTLNAQILLLSEAAAYHATIYIGIMGPNVRKPVFWVPDKVHLKPLCSATEIS